MVPTVDVDSRWLAATQVRAQIQCSARETRYQCAIDISYRVAHSFIRKRKEDIV